MKTLYLYTIALLTTFAVPALADPLVLDGCEIVQAENGNHFVKADPTCVFVRDGLGETGDGKLNPRNPAT